MEIWLKHGKEKVKIPVLPSGYDIQSPQNNETVTTVNGREITLIGKKGLRSISWSSFFPQGKPSYLQKKSGYTGKPWGYINKIGKMKGKVITLVMTGTNVNFQATIENFNYGEKDGSGDIEYSIEFKEYPKPKTKKKGSNQKETTNTSSTKATKPDTKTSTKDVTTKTYVVKKGDTLTSIAKKQTGSSANWRAIYNANKKTIGSNPNKIYPGQKLVIKV